MKAWPIFALSSRSLFSIDGKLPLIKKKMKHFNSLLLNSITQLILLKEMPFQFSNFWICQILEEFLIVLTQSFQAEVHNPKSRSAMEYSLPVCTNYIFLENNYTGISRAASFVLNQSGAMS